MPPTRPRWPAAVAAPGAVVADAAAARRGTGRNNRAADRRQRSSCRAAGTACRDASAATVTGRVQMFMGCLPRRLRRTAPAAKRRPEPPLAATAGNVALRDHPHPLGQRPAEFRSCITGFNALATPSDRRRRPLASASTADATPRSKGPGRARARSRHLPRDHAADRPPGGRVPKGDELPRARVRALIVHRQRDRPPPADGAPEAGGGQVIAGDRHGHRPPRRPAGSGTGDRVAVIQSAPPVGLAAWPSTIRWPSLTWSDIGRHRLRGHSRWKPAQPGLGCRGNCRDGARQPRWQSRWPVSCWPPGASS